MTTPFTNPFLPWPKVRHYEAIPADGNLEEYQRNLAKDTAYILTHANYDEAKAGDLPLPPLLADPDTGRAIHSPGEWPALRQKHRENLERILYGKLPPLPQASHWEILQEKEVFQGTCLMRIVRLTLENQGRSHQATLLCHIPRRPYPVPAIVALNFQGNHACTPDGDVPLSPWAQLSAHSRGAQANRWDFRLLCDAGFAVVTCAYYDFYPDHVLGRAQSVFRLFHPQEELTPRDRDYTAISAWAYGYSRLREVAAAFPEVDPAQIWAHGHSRLGKTALWTIAHDDQWAGAVSNCSGCGGAAISRRNYGESLECIDHVFSWWTTGNCRPYAEHPETLPFDQHTLLALAAPRPVLVTGAREDQWADPMGQFIAVLHAQEAYRLLGRSGLPSTEHPPLGELLMSPSQGYYERYGIHDVTDEDWRNTLRFIRQSR